MAGNIRHNIYDKKIKSMFTQVASKKVGHVRPKRIAAKVNIVFFTNIFCVAFDLSILTAYNSQSFYKFVYHDDVFANKDRGVKNRFLDLVNKLTKSFDLQYIFNIIKGDLPMDDDNNYIHFRKEDIILNLHDKDSTGTLFGFSF